MPKGDGTGPRGQGPRSGRGMGKCGGAEKAPVAEREGVLSMLMQKVEFIEKNLTALRDEIKTLTTTKSDEKE